MSTLISRSGRLDCVDNSKQKSVPNQNQHISETYASYHCIIHSYCGAKNKQTRVLRTSMKNSNMNGAFCFLKILCEHIWGGRQVWRKILTTPIFGKLVEYVAALRVYGYSVNDPCNTGFKQCSRLDDTSVESPQKLFVVMITNKTVRINAS